MPKTESVGIRLEPEVKGALAKAAKDDHRTIASYIMMVLVTHLRDRGYLQ